MIYKLRKFLNFEKNDNIRLNNMKKLLKVQQMAINGFEKAFELKKEVCIALINNEDCEDIIESLRAESYKYTKDQLRYFAIEMIEILSSVNYSNNEILNCELKFGAK